MKKEVKTAEEIKEILVDKINRSEWWHVLPRDPEAYNKRGKFLASTYRQAEFYGRPCDIPERVFISDPVYGFSEKEILEQLFQGKGDSYLLDDFPEARDNWYQERIDLDAKMYRMAKSLGYDAIVLVGRTGREELERNRKPYSIELNLLNV